jgi:small subunit ribosomal protein S18
MTEQFESGKQKQAKPKLTSEPTEKPKTVRKPKTNSDIAKRKKATALELRRANIQKQLNPPPVRPFIGVAKPTSEELEKEREKKQTQLRRKRFTRRKYRWIRRGVSHRRRYDPRYLSWRRRRYQKKHNKKTKPRKIPMVLAKQGVHGKMNQTILDYKNLFLLRQYLTIQGKIKPRKKTRLTAKKQRKMATTIKTARVMGLLPFIRR